MRNNVGLNSPTDTEQRLSGDRPAAGACHTGDVARSRGASDCVGSCPAGRRRGKAHRHRAHTLSAQPTPHPARQTFLAVAVVLTAGLLLGGCSTRGTADQHAAPASPSSPEASEFAGGPVAVHFAIRFTEDGESYKETFDVIAAGPRKVRLKVVGPDIGRILEVWDGTHLLEHDQDSVFPYTVYEAPSEHPDELSGIQEFMIGDPTSNPNPLCKHAERLTGARQVRGRTAIRYRCQPNNDSLLGATILVDQSTGLLLRTGPLHGRVDTSPTVTANTFSTQAPPGAKVDIIAAKHPTGSKPPHQKAPPFRLQLLDGGTVSSAEFDGKPYVLAFFSSDLYYDHGEICPRCVPALLLAQQLSHHGTDPTVLAVQNGERGKPGLPLVPAGLTLRIANDPDTALQHAYGLTHEVGFAFVGSEGAIRAVIDHPATSTEISDALSKLN